IIVHYNLPTVVRIIICNNAKVRSVNNERLNVIFEGTKSIEKNLRRLMRDVALRNEVVPNALARQTMPWLTPRPNKGWTYRWWGENFVFPEGVQILLRAMGLDP